MQDFGLKTCAKVKFPVYPDNQTSTENAEAVGFLGVDICLQVLLYISW